MRDITFSTLSSSTLLPFYGAIHIAYVPSRGVILGLSKLARVTRVLAARLQSQWALTQAVLRAFAEELAPLGAAVVCVARHLGSARPEGLTEPRVTCAVTGSLKAPERLAELELLLGLAPGAAHAARAEGVTDAPEPLDLSHEALSPKEEGAAPLDEARRGAMAAAVRDLLAAATEGRGTTSSRDAPVPGASRYVDWLWHATAGYRMPAETAGLDDALDGAATPSSGASELMDFDPAHVDPGAAPQGTPRGWRHVRGASVDDSGSGEEGDACRPVSPGALMASLAHAAPRPSLQVASLHFSSECEHHLLPFHGTVGVAVQGAGALPPRLLRRAVDRFARRLQVQERLGNQVADALWEAVPGARGLLVVVRSAHMCMVARGVEQHASTTMTTCARGAMAGDAAARLAALQALLQEPARG